MPLEVNMALTRHTPLPCPSIHWAAQQDKGPVLSRRDAREGDQGQKRTERAQRELGAGAGDRE